MAHTRRISAVLLCASALALAALLLAAAPKPAEAAGRNGWYWPTGHGATSTGGGWLQHRYYTVSGVRREAWHLAWDDCGVVHEPVYSLGWGVVDFASMQVYGYGWNPITHRPGRGGAIVVKYRSSDGGYFKALYGHLDFDESSLPVGAVVRPGQQIAVTTAYSTVPHVHFGIHLGSEDPTPPVTPYTGSVSMLMGHTFQYTMRGTAKVPTTYGFVDPVLYLNTHTPWVSPPATVSTPTVPARVPAMGAFRAYGTFSPGAAPGSRVVRIECQHLEGGAWVPGGVFSGITRNPSGATYTVPTRLALPGAWRVRAYAPTSVEWSAATSGWAYLTAY